MHNFPVESPGGTVVSKGDVFPISGQNICGYLHHTKVRDGQGTKPLVTIAVKTKWKMKKRYYRYYTHTSWSPCKYLSLLQQHFLGMYVVVDYHDTVGAHHQRVRLSVFPLQFFEKHMGRVWTPQTQQTADKG